jgi:hypothetical protein
MRGIAARAARAVPKSSLFLGVTLMAALLSGCAHHSSDSDTAATVNAFPANYKADILGAMHAYLNNPTGIRDAAISEPALKTIGNTTRYTVCLKFNAKKDGSNDYAGSKEIAAIFQVGRFDRFSELIRDTKDLCAGAVYAPFPELQKLPP